MAWTEEGYSGPDVWARGLDNRGGTAGRLPALRFNPSTSDRQEEPALAVTSWGEVNIAYTDDADGNRSDQIHLRTGFANAIWAGYSAAARQARLSTTASLYSTR